MDQLNDTLLVLSGLLDPKLLVFLLLSLSHLVLPLLALLNSDSHLCKKIPGHVSFLYDWPYHLGYVGLIPATIWLISKFHEKANDFAENILENHGTGFAQLMESKFTGILYIPVICIIVASAISFLLYKVNRKSYIKAGKTTWWFPNPSGKPALSTIVLHIPGAIVGSTILVYVIHHVVISMNVHSLLGSWTEGVIGNMEVIRLTTRFYSMTRYFSNFIYPLLPAVIICCINIGYRRAELHAKFADPVVILTVIGITVVLFLLYLVPLIATGLASKIYFAKITVDDQRVRELAIYPYALLLLSILSPLLSAISPKVIKRLM